MYLELKYILYLVSEPQHGSCTQPFSRVRSAVYHYCLLLGSTGGSGDLNIICITIGLNVR